MKYKGIIFDMDGTLIDNHSFWSAADGQFLQKYNIPQTQEYVNMVNGRSVQESVALIREQYNIEHPYEEILAEKIRLTDHIYEVAGPMLGAQDLLVRIKKLDHKSAIASGSSLKRVERIVERMQWQDYFNSLVSADHVGYVGKPDPAVYRYASEQLGLRPEECVVIEDARNGLLSAKAAGMACVVINMKPMEDFSLADAVFSSLEEDGLYTFLGLTKV